MYKIQMMTTMSLAVLLTACARATASDNSIAPASGSVTVTGRVVSSTGTPIPDARVYIPGAGEATPHRRKRELQPDRRAGRTPGSRRASPVLCAVVSRRKAFEEVAGTE